MSDLFLCSPDVSRCPPEICRSADLFCAQGDVVWMETPINLVAGSVILGYGRPVLGASGFGGRVNICVTPFRTEKLPDIRVRYFLRTLLMTHEKRSELPNTSDYVGLSAQSLVPGR